MFDTLITYCQYSEGFANKGIFQTLWILLVKQKQVYNFLSRAHYLSHKLERYLQVSISGKTKFRMFPLDILEICEKTKSTFEFINMTSISFYGTDLYL